MKRTGGRPGEAPAPGGDGPTGSSSRVPVVCLAVFALAWAALAVAPRYRADWLLENLPVFVAVPALVLGHRRFRFSDRACVQGTIFLLLHAIGSHYTYSEVPIDAWLGRAAGFGRNHYDRLVHFLYGVLLLRPIRELSFRGREPGRFATLALSVAAVIAGGALYEIVEWLVASVADPEAGTAFLGTQGDEWDAQKDMALAGVGAVIAALVELAVDPPPSGEPRRGHGDGARGRDPRKA
ncbi:DUF2238 domain-containing protein [bacterium]|nr:DUF2238 domain-containing protein [bacterium]